jgi:hypothetical protein
MLRRQRLEDSESSRRCKWIGVRLSSRVHQTNPALRQPYRNQTHQADAGRPAFYSRLAHPLSVRTAQDAQCRQHMDRGDLATVGDAATEVPGTEYICRYVLVCLGPNETGNNPIIPLSGVALMMCPAPRPQRRDSRRSGRARDDVEVARSRFHALNSPDAEERQNPRVAGDSLPCLPGLAVRQDSNQVCSCLTPCPWRRLLCRADLRNALCCTCPCPVPTYPALQCRPPDCCLQAARAECLTCAGAVPTYLPN